MGESGQAVTLARGGGQWIAVLLALFAIAPLTYPGFFQSHSGLLPIYHLYDLETHLGLVDWLPAIGQAADPFRGSGSLPYAVALAVRWLGASGPQAILASYALAFAVGAWAMYRWTRHWLGLSAALLAATLYTYLPFHLAVVYVRGNPGEAWTFALWPVTFWAAHRLRQPARRPLDLILALAAFGLLCTANLGLALLTLPLLVAYVWACGGMSPVVGAGAVGAAVLVVTGVAHLLAARYPIPVAFTDHFPYLFQFVSPVWNVAGQVSGWLNALPLQVGLAALGLSVLAALLLWRAGRSPATASTRTRLVWFWLAVAGISALLMLRPLQVLWQVSGWERLLTYPWQMMGFLGLALSAAGASVVALDRRLRTGIVQAGLVTFVILASYSYLTPRFFDFEINFTPQAKVAHTYTMTPRTAPVAILGDNQVALLDYRIEGPLRHGATVRVNVLWQALRPLDQDYMAFVHALDQAGTIRGQRDSEPLDGKYPTTQWGAGEIVADRYELQIDPNGPREGYQLEMGLYRKDTGERLAIGGDTKVVIADE